MSVKVTKDIKDSILFLTHFDLNKSALRPIANLRVMCTFSMLSLPLHTAQQRKRPFAKVGYIAKMKITRCITFGGAYLKICKSKLFNIE